MRERTHDHATVDHPERDESMGQAAVRLLAPAGAASRPVCPPALRPRHRPRRALRSVGGDEVAAAAVARPGLRQARVCGPTALRGATSGEPSDREVGHRPAAGGLRLVVGPPSTPARRPGHRWRRIAAGFAVALGAAALVIGLGRLADGVAQMRAPATSGAIVVAVSPAVDATADAATDPATTDMTVTVQAPGTVWDVVDAVAPGVSGPERAALADRVVAANALPSALVRTGQVLRVPRGI